MFEYFDEVEFELFQYDCESDDDSDSISPEDWQDLNSEDLLDVWMSIVEYHEFWYLPLKKTFNDLCEFVYNTQDTMDEVITHEVQAIENHKFVKNRNWEYFFSE